MNNTTRALIAGLSLIAAPSTAGLAFTVHQSNSVAVLEARTDTVEQNIKTIRDDLSWIKQYLIQNK